jgi:hypothetical protein
VPQRGEADVKAALPSVSEISVTITLSRQAEEAGDALDGLLRKQLLATRLGEPTIQMSFED